MLYEYRLSTKKQHLYNITGQLREAITQSGVTEGLAIVFCPHTTAAITINENADPDVLTDIIFGLSKAFPGRPEFAHFEGNSAAHLKASCVGESVTIVVSEGKPVLGTWQGVYFCEFDPPRSRRFWVKVMG